MKENRVHLVPQIVIDCADNMIKSTNPNTKDIYTSRLEAIRDYCNEMLQKNAGSSSINYDRKSRSHKYSRIGLNNV